MRADPIWMRLQSGRTLDLLNPDPQGWTDADLAYRLSRTHRWSGDTAWERPLTVAQHSLTVLAIREAISPGLPIAARLRELMHDAEEGLLAFDPLSPLKAHLGAPFADITARLRRAIDERYALPAWEGDEDYHMHKYADRVAAASEARHVVGWSGAAILDQLRLYATPLMADPLPRPPGLQPWEPWPASVAASRFLQRLDELRQGDAARSLDAEPTPPPRLPEPTSPPTLVLVEGGCESVEGQVVNGERDSDGVWDFDGVFTVRTIDGDLVRVQGWNCITEVLS